MLVTLEHEHELKQLATIGYDESVPCVLLQWNGYVNSEQFRKISDEALGLLKARKVSGILNDTTHLPIIGAEDQEWVRSDFLSRGMAHGFRFCAMVNSRFYFNRVAVDNVVQQLDRNKFVVEYFQNAADALSWLRTTSGH